MEPAGLSSRYGARRLCDSDVGAVYRLSAGNPIFYKYCPPCVTLESIREDMKVLPPGKSGEDKFYVGFFDGSMLTAVMDLILKYPNDETAFIGLFMVDSASQGKGTGTAIIEECLCFLKRQGLRRARLGFAKGNCQSEAFWTKNGFVRTGEEVNNGSYTAVGDGKGAVTRAKAGGYKKRSARPESGKIKSGMYHTSPIFNSKRTDGHSGLSADPAAGRAGASLYRMSCVRSSTWSSS